LLELKQLFEESDMKSLQSEKNAETWMERDKGKRRWFGGK
jgi:hypothetical protein